MQITSRSGAIAVKTFYDYDVASFMCNTIYPILYYTCLSVCVSFSICFRIFGQAPRWRDLCVWQGLVQKLYANFKEITLRRLIIALY